MSGVRPERGGRTVFVLIAVLGTMALSAGVAVAAYIYGTAGDDTIQGTNKFDIIYSLKGNDTVYPNGGGDYVGTADGNDTVCQSAGSDQLNAGPGNDVVIESTAIAGGEPCPGAAPAGNDSDVLVGNSGADRLNSVDGDALDVVDGGAGVDQCAVDSGEARSGCEVVEVH